MIPRRSRRRHIIGRIFDAIVEPPAPRRAYVPDVARSAADGDWPLPPVADWAAFEWSAR